MAQMELTDAFKELPTPCYLVDESLLIKNLKILDLQYTQMKIQMKKFY